MSQLLNGIIPLRLVAAFGHHKIDLLQLPIVLSNDLSLDKNGVLCKQNSIWIIYISWAQWNYKSFGPVASIELIICCLWQYIKKENSAAILTTSNKKIRDVQPDWNIDYNPDPDHCSCKNHNILPLNEDYGLAAPMYSFTYCAEYTCCIQIKHRLRNSPTINKQPN